MLQLLAKQERPARRIRLATTGKTHARTPAGYWSDPNLQAKCSSIVFLSRTGKCANRAQGQTPQRTVRVCDVLRARIIL